MAEYLRRVYPVDRIAIVDTDCHHGDGTQDIYWHDPDTLFISLHQDGRTLYPGSGFTQEQGGPNAFGTTVNIPLPPYTGEAGFLKVIENIVLPIVEDFKPDLIINSAGQDNHFSDPITNMNFSAQGYAKLTEMLKPDIAVLEGGYSIEGALPYMNVGIILAMAGIDYSKVKEPDYNPEKVREKPQIGEYIDRLCIEILANWKEKDRLKARIQKDKDFVERKRDIFYDTDNIMEQQKEKIRVCPDCAGALRIDTTSDRWGRILAVHIPRKACETCRDMGYRWYEEDTGDVFQQVFLQDRTKDIYLEKKKKGLH